MSTSKKIRERFLLDRFLELARIYPTRILEEESPDFLLEFDNRSVGLEVTELHVESVETGGLSLRALESVTDRIVSAAQKVFEAEHKKSIFVSVSFFERQLSKHSRRDEVAVAIADQVGRLVQGGEEFSQWRNNYSNSELDSVASLSVHATSKYKKGRWVVARSGWVSPLAIEIIQAAVDRKNARHASYTKRIPEAWLLLAFDGGRPSQFFDIEPEIELSKVESEFARTYLLRTVPPLLYSHARGAA